MEYNASHNAYSSGLGKKDARRAEARRRLRLLGAHRKATLAASLGVENTTRDLVRHAAEYGLAGWPKV